MRIFAVSDLHTDFAENRRRLQQVSLTAYLHDVLIVAGDIADDLKIIDWTLRKLRSQFGRVLTLKSRPLLKRAICVASSGLREPFPAITRCGASSIRSIHHC